MHYDNDDERRSFGITNVDRRKEDGGAHTGSEDDQQDSKGHHKGSFYTKSFRNLEGYFF